MSLLSGVPIHSVPLFAESSARKVPGNNMQRRWEPIEVSWSEFQCYPEVDLQLSFETLFAI